MDLKKKIKLIECISYSPRKGFIWHKKNGIDKEVRAANLEQLKYIIATEFKKEAIIYDKLELKWR